MKFSTQEVMDTPAEVAFALLTDFEHLERAAMRRGVDVRRLDDLADPGTGLAWEAAFVLRGRDRQVSLEVADYQPPHHVALDFASQGLQGEARLELIPLSRHRTRVMVSLEMRPSTLPARLMLQSLKLAKQRLTQRYKDRVAAHIEELEGRYKSTA